MILIALFVNEFVLGLFVHTQGVYGEAHYLVLIRYFDAVFILLGLANLLFRRDMLILRIDLLLFSAAVALCGSEWFFRSREYLEDDLLLNKHRWHVKDPYLHHTLAPNTCVVLKWGRTHHTFCSNNLGYRDERIRTVSKHATTDRRLLVLGDSFTESVGVDYGSSFAPRLEKGLRQDRFDIEILNAGVASYCPRLEYRKLEQFFSEGYTTDRVLLMLDISDIEDESSDRWVGDWSWFDESEMELWRQRRASQIRSIEKRKESSRLYHLVRPRLTTRLSSWWERLTRANNNGAAAPLAHLFENDRYAWTQMDLEHPENQWIREGIARCQEGISRMSSLCAAYDTQFAFVIYPHVVQLARRENPCLHQTVFSDYAHQEGVTIFDLFPAFSTVNDFRDYFLRGDIHWNEKGHEYVAELLQEILRTWWHEAGEQSS